MISELGGAAVHSACRRAGSRAPRAAVAGADPARRCTPTQLPHAARVDRRAREHAQQRGRHRLAARGAARRRRRRARARPRSCTSTARGSRTRRSRSASRRHEIGRAVRHGHAVPLEGARLPARRGDRRLGRADGARPASRSTASAARCARRGSSPRPGCTRSSTTSTGSPTTTRARGGSPRAGPRAACRSSSSACETNFVQVDVGALDLDHGRGARGGSREAGVGAVARPSRPACCVPSRTSTSTTTTSSARSSSSRRRSDVLVRA